MRGQGFPRNNDLEKRFGNKPVGIGGIDQYTKLMLHGDDLVDSSLYPKVINNNGVTVSTAQSKFGGKSLYFDSSTSTKLTITDSDVFFTVGSLDWWMYFPTVANNYTPICGGASSTNGYIQIVSGQLRYYTPANSNTGNFGNPPSGVWGHYELSADGTTLRCFYNGNLTTSSAYSSDVFTPSAGLTIGAGMNISTPMYIDELRFSSIPRHTSNFTPPNAPYSI